MSSLVTCPECQAKNRLRTHVASAKIPSCGRCGSFLPWLVDVGDASFEREIDVTLPVLVDLWAPWCGPCRMVAPVLEELANELAGRLKVVKVNVDQNPSLAARFDARSIPLLVVLHGGEVKQRLLGAQPKATLRQALASYL